jgi:hypothetical protein
LELNVDTFKVMIDNDIAGVGLGGSVTEKDLEGWDLPNLLKTGAIALIEKTNTKEKEVD